MKRILTFEFDHEESDDYLIVANALRFRDGIQELVDFLRSKVKYAIDQNVDLPKAEDLVGLNEDEAKAAIAQHVFDICRDKLWEIIEEAGV